MLMDIIVTLILLMVFTFLGIILCFRKKYSPPSPIKEKSHAFHEPVGKYEEKHLDRVGKDLIRHPEPEVGYVVLNGVKRRLEDCKNL